MSLDAQTIKTTVRDADVAKMLEKSKKKGDCACCSMGFSWGGDTEHLTLIDLRTSNYREQCVRVAAGPFPGAVKNADDIAIDHVIELWEVKKAYMFVSKACGQKSPKRVLSNSVVYFDATIKDIDKVTKENILQWVKGDHAWWPLDLAGHLEALYDIRGILNSSENLCAVNSDWNLAKNKALSAKVSDGNSIRELQWYYVANQNHYYNTVAQLVQLFVKEGNLLYWGVAMILYAQFEVLINDGKLPESGPLTKEDNDSMKLLREAIPELKKL